MHGPSSRQHGLEAAAKDRAPGLARERKLHCFQIFGAFSAQNFRAFGNATKTMTNDNIRFL
jgi:hypothetical protein